MPVPHLSIGIVRRSQGKSAVAGAAYQSGERLFSEYDQKYKDYRNKSGILYTEILLPANAPPEYTDRAALWNSVEEIEKQWNAQLARRFVLALPREVPSELFPNMVKEYCREHFVSKGMCCDIAVHDPHPPGHNPHCHVMLTMRAMDEQGRWLPKSKKVYELDEAGERIRLPSGNWKCHKESSTDWNEQSHGEEWRHGWEVIQNRYLEQVGSSARVDLRSYERQGSDMIPTVHMGPAVTQMERRGIATNIGNLNRDIRAANRLLHAIRKTIRSLQTWIGEIREALRAGEREDSPSLSSLLDAYMIMRKEERSEWSRYGKQKGAASDLKTVSQAIVYLQTHKLFTLADLEQALEETNRKARELNTARKRTESRMRAISGIQNAAATCNRYREIHDQYLKIGWKSRKEVFAEKHKDELERFNRAYRYLKKQGIDPAVDLGDLQKEYEELVVTQAGLAARFDVVREELKPMKDIRYWINRVLDEGGGLPGKAAEPRHSVAGQIEYIQTEENRAATSSERRETQNPELGK